MENHQKNGEMTYLADTDIGAPVIPPKFNFEELVKVMGDTPAPLLLYVIVFIITLMYYGRFMKKVLEKIGSPNSLQERLDYAAVVRYSPEEDVKYGTHLLFANVFGRSAKNRNVILFFIKANRQIAMLRILMSGVTSNLVVAIVSILLCFLMSYLAAQQAGILYIIMPLLTPMVAGVLLTCVRLPLLSTEDTISVYEGGEKMSSVERDANDVKHSERDAGKSERELNEEQDA